MFRGILTARFLGLLALLVAVVTATTLLGLWQLGVARDEGQREAVAAGAALERRPLQEVTQPYSAFEADFSNRPVAVTGTYEKDGQVLVVDRRLGDRSGSWVVTPLRLPDGGTVAVLRGIVDGTPERVPAPPEGEVTVLGTLGPSESPRPGSDPLPEPQRHSLDLAALVNEWPGDLYNVVVVASSESTAGTPVDPDGLTRVPPPEVVAGLHLKNAAYAVQWWVFGLFAVWMWWKIVRSERRPDDLGEHHPGSRPSDPPPATVPAARPAHEEETRV